MTERGRKTAAQVVWVGEGLELAQDSGIGGRCGGVPGACGDGGEKTALRGEGFGAQACGFTGGLERGEIDVGGEVLLSRRGKQIGAGTVLGVGAEGSVRAAGREKIEGAQAVVEREEFAAA